MVRNSAWLVTTGIAVVLALAYPTSANQGVPYGRTPGATATTGKTSVGTKPSPAVTHAPAAVPSR